MNVFLFFLLHVGLIVLVDLCSYLKRNKYFNLYLFTGDGHAAKYCIQIVEKNPVIIFIGWIINSVFIACSWMKEGLIKQKKVQDHF